MNSYALAFGILGGGVVLAALLWLAPRFRQRSTVRKFRKALDQIDLVALSWSQGPPEDDRDDLSTTPPESRPLRRRRDDQPDDGGAALV
ncbi:MAG: hypothetical protein M3314_09820 [Actinomycetota bacterium]|nr:hypothetical protein [Actinomycetota bacterium]